MTTLWQFNERGTFTVTSFHLDHEVTGWTCPCGCRLVLGILGPGMEKVDEGAVVPCLNCDALYGLTYGLRLRAPTLAEFMDAELYLSGMIAEWREEAMIGRELAVVGYDPPQDEEIPF